MVARVYIPRCCDPFGAKISTTHSALFFFFLVPVPLPYPRKAYRYRKGGPSELQANETAQPFFVFKPAFAQTDDRYPMGFLSGLWCLAFFVFLLFILSTILLWDLHQPMINTLRASSENCHVFQLKIIMCFILPLLERLFSRFLRKQMADIPRVSSVNRYAATIPACSWIYRSRATSSVYTSARVLHVPHSWSDVFLIVMPCRASWNYNIRNHFANNALPLRCSFRPLILKS